MHSCPKETNSKNFAQPWWFLKRTECVRIAVNHWGRSLDPGSFSITCRMSDSLFRCPLAAWSMACRLLCTAHWGYMLARVLPLLMLTLVTWLRSCLLCFSTVKRLLLHQYSAWPTGLLAAGSMSEALLLKHSISITWRTLLSMWIRSQHVFLFRALPHDGSTNSAKCNTYLTLDICTT